MSSPGLTPGPGESTLDPETAGALRPMRSSGQRIAIAMSVFGVLFALAYPFAVYWGLTHLGARDLGLILLALHVPWIALRLRRLDKAARVTVLRAPLIIAVLAGVTALFDDVRAMLALPVLINLALLYTFAVSLRNSRSIIEHFARLLVSDLSAEECQYCRTVTRVWCGFFALNATAAGLLALFAPLTWWVVYTGLIAYILMGILFTVEVIARFLRFRRTGVPWMDRLLGRVFRGVSS